MSNVETFSSVWDAVADTPAQAANLQARAELMRQIAQIVKVAGWTQAEGEARVTINAGDVVWCPPGIRHWHGATDSSAMTHLAIQQAEDTSVVDWMEPVTEAQYLGQ